VLPREQEDWHVALMSTDDGDHDVVAGRAGMIGIFVTCNLL
jgi:hypothetical protein